MAISLTDLVQRGFSGDDVPDDDLLKIVLDHPADVREIACGRRELGEYGREHVFLERYPHDLQSRPGGGADAHELRPGVRSGRKPHTVAVRRASGG